MKKYTLIVVLLFTSLLFVFSNPVEESTVSQDSLRVVSLAPNITEIICALGAQDNLVGRSDNCNYPSEVLTIPSAGNVWQPNIEVIVSMQPDVVLAASLLDPSYKQAIERAGINVVHILSEETVEGTYDLIKQVGQAIGFEEEANKLASDVQKEFNETEEKTALVKNKKSCVYLLGWGEFGDYAATGDTFINGLIELAGGINVAKEAKYWEISQELLIESNPDLIILPDYEYAKADVNSFRSIEPYSELTGNIAVVNGDIADRQGVRSPEFVKTVAENLYPELFK